MGTNGTAIDDGSLGFHCCCGGKLGSNCAYVSEKVTYTDVDKINASNVYFGTSPLPERVQGAFWLKDDGGNSLIGLGTPPGGDGSGECNNGRLSKQEGNLYCTFISTVHPGGWAFQAVAAPVHPFGGKFPSPADEFYRKCGMKWKYCAIKDLTKLDLIPSPMRSCVNVFALSSTTGEYKGTLYGGQYWKITTKALGIVPLPSWIPGNFDMIQVMDGKGNKIQPAWDMFAKDNKQIVTYDAKEEVTRL